MLAEAATLIQVSVRLDKWLQVARVFRTRSLATRACALGRVRVNGAPAKPHRALAVGDRLEVALGEWTRVLVVRVLRDRPVPKAEAAGLFEDQSPERPAADPVARLLSRPPAPRASGSGRPTKRQRRDLERWRRGQE
jgi:ribosome-associated heat shock protein Hsp15